MKKAELEFVAFDTEDVITTSGVLVHYYVWGEQEKDILPEKWIFYAQEYHGNDKVGEIQICRRGELSKIQFLSKGWYTDPWNGVSCVKDHEHPNPPV